MAVTRAWVNSGYKALAVERNFDSALDFLSDSGFCCSMLLLVFAMGCGCAGCACLFVLDRHLAWDDSKGLVRTGWRHVREVRP